MEMIFSSLPLTTMNGVLMKLMRSVRMFDIARFFLIKGKFFLSLREITNDTPEENENYSKGNEADQFHYTEFKSIQ